ncbi:MAG: class I SAM-dependent methyltransferase, partial [Candidatus Omnitrophica bacterium]|nr:class I SAM-dependent methyltransferase [Candidatus Omnitrophota bacterium]
IASLDYLSKSEEFPGLKGHETKALDIACGPSTLYKAYERGREIFQALGLTLDITDLDANETMLRLGQFREERQLLGRMEDLSKAIDEGILKEGEYGLVNMSYAFRYAEHPLALMKNIHRLLKEGGIFSLILPDAHIIPPQFIEAMEALGFEVTGERKLISSLDDEAYRDLVDEFGEEFAQDVLHQTQGEFSYLVARKIKATELAEALQDSDFIISREASKRLDNEKLRKMLASASKTRIIPETVLVNGDVVFIEDILPSTANPSDVGRNGKAQAVDPLRQPLRLISELFIHSHQWYGNRGVREKSEKLHQKLGEISGALNAWIRKNVGTLETDKKEQLSVRIDSLETTNHVRCWFNHHKSVVNSLRLALNASMVTSRVHVNASNGGIDLSLANNLLQSKNNGQEIKFHIDAAMLKQLQNAPGFVPVIIDIQPMADLRYFLGANNQKYL